MTPKIVVVTALTDLRDKLQPIEAQPGVKAVCFTNRQISAPGWEIRPLLWEHESPVRTARWHKVRLMPEDLGYSNTQLKTLWIDGTHKLTRSPLDIFKYYGDPEFALFRHAERDCIYTEVDACINLRKDDPGVLKSQAERYKLDGHPARGGLWVSWLLYRRYTPAVRELCLRWWAEIAHGSCRDQVSLPYVLRRSDVRVTEMRGKWFDYTPHKRQLLI